MTGSRYAKDTGVTVRKSQAEIGDVLERYGADQQLFGSEDGRAIVAFRMGGKQIRIDVPMPRLEDFRKTPDKGLLRSVEVQRTFWEQACRARWRVLLLVLKAKLEAVEVGISTIEREFLADVVLPSGATVGEWAVPQIERAYSTGEMPKLLPEGRNQ